MLGKSYLSSLPDKWAAAEHETLTNGTTFAPQRPGTTACASRFDNGCALATTQRIYDICEALEQTLP